MQRLPLPINRRCIEHHLARARVAALAKEQNPVLGFYDPIGLADLDLWGQGEEASIGTLSLLCLPSRLLSLHFHARRSLAISSKPRHSWRFLLIRD